MTRTNFFKAAGATLFGGSVASAVTTRERWEYDNYFFPYDESNKHDREVLNKFGADGWEMIQIVNNRAYFKRRLG